MLAYEREAWNAGHRLLAGVDEAGRGPLAGPVVAAAVCIDRHTALRELSGSLDGLTDSKQLSAAARERYAAALRASRGIRIGLGVVDPALIDRVNILQATILAMTRALQALPHLPDLALVDGRPVAGLPCPSRAIVRGDGASLSIAAASVIAKVERDRMMVELDALHPGYGLARHKGYGTPEHLAALRALGPCACHRRSFRPIAPDPQRDLFRGAPCAG
jgi:ribonuclease HII